MATVQGTQSLCRFSFVHPPILCIPDLFSRTPRSGPPTALGAGPSEPLLPQLLDDGLIEVVGVKSTVHLGQIQLGLSRAVPIAQASAEWIPRRPGPSRPPSLAEVLTLIDSTATQLQQRHDVCDVFSARACPDKPPDTGDPTSRRARVFTSRPRPLCSCKWTASPGCCRRPTCASTSTARPPCSGDPGQALQGWSRQRCLRCVLTAMGREWQCN